MEAHVGVPLCSEDVGRLAPPHIHLTTFLPALERSHKSVSYNISLNSAEFFHYGLYGSIQTQFVYAETIASFGSETDDFSKVLLSDD